MQLDIPDHVLASVGSYARVRVVGPGTSDSFTLLQLTQGMVVYRLARVGKTRITVELDRRVEGVREGAVKILLRTSAVNALVLAGSGAPLDGVPYDGAFDRMVRVHRSAASYYIRARTLGGMLGTPSHSRAVSYLGQIAESSDSTAVDAIQFLIADANGGGWARTPTASDQQESVAALKTLAARKRVTDGGAAKLLGLWIARNGS